MRKIETIVFSVTLLIQLLLIRKQDGIISERMNNMATVPNSVRNKCPIHAPTGPTRCFTDAPFNRDE